MAIGANMTKREQTMIVIAVLSALLGGAFWYLVYKPKSVELGVIQVHVDSLETHNKQAIVEMQKGSASQLRAQAEVYQKNLEVMRQLVPASNEVPALIDAVSTAARRVGLEIAQLNPAPPIPGDQFDTYRYSVQIVGGYHRLGQVLASIGSLPRIVAPVNVKLERATGQSKGRPRAGESPVLVTFDLQTYVAKGGATGRPGT